MTDPFVAEVRIFPFNFAPKGWAFCQGQLMPISQNTALFSLLGTVYGGDGRSTFGLPNLRDNTPLQQGQSSTGAQYSLGQKGGSTTVTLLQSEMAAHSHANNVAGGRNVANNFVPSPTTVLAPSTNANAYKTGTPALGAMSQTTYMPVGGGQPHNNTQPYLTLSYCISLQGVFPQRP